MESPDPVLISETFNNISSHLIFEYYNDQPTERFAAKFQIFAPMSISISDDLVRSFYYFPEEVESDREKMIFLRQFQAKKMHGVYTVYFNSRLFPQLLSLDQFMKIPSVIMDDIRLINGHHFFYLRFNSEFTREISNLVIDMISEGDQYQVLSFGDNAGKDFLNENEKMNTNRELRFVRLVVENYHEEPVKGFSIPDGTVREFKTHSGTNTGRAVYYFPESHKFSPPDEFFRISDSKSHYEGPAESEITSFLSTYENSIPLPAVSRIQKFDGNRLTVEYLLDDWAVEILIRRLSEARKKFTDQVMYIDYASDVLDSEAISFS